MAAAAAAAADVRDKRKGGENDRRDFFSPLFCCCCWSDLFWTSRRRWKTPGSPAVCSSTPWRRTALEPAARLLSPPDLVEPEAQRHTEGSRLRRHGFSETTRGQLTDTAHTRTARLLHAITMNCSIYTLTTSLFLGLIPSVVFTCT